MPRSLSVTDAARPWAVYGCSSAEAREINGGAPLYASGCPAKDYLVQKSNARRRGIEWQLSLPEWWRIWLASGRLAERGSRPGQYCMSRHGDVGPYAAGNVFIQLSRQNSLDGCRRWKNGPPWEKGLRRKGAMAERRAMQAATHEPA